jgi:hypothetical protein
LPAFATFGQHRDRHLVPLQPEVVERVLHRFVDGPADCLNAFHHVSLSSFGCLLAGELGEG